MDVNKIIEIIGDNDLEKVIFHWDENDKWSEHTDFLDDIYSNLDLSQKEGEKWFKSLNLGKIEAKSKREDTSEFWSVVYFKDYDIYLKISGEYDSYGNYEHEYSEIKEVKPQKITKTIYN